MGDAPFPLKSALKVTHPPVRKLRLRPISAHNVSTVGDSEKRSITTNIKLTMGFPTSYIDGVRTLSLSPERVAQKAIFPFFGIKVNFNGIKSATKFLCVKTSNGKVVDQSISYEVTEKNIGRKVFPST